MTDAARPRLLVVDDQPINIQSLYRVFCADHQVFVATGGVQALEVAVQQRPDLILLDLEMDDLHGFEVCRRLKADPVTAEIPVIFVTAHGGEAMECQGLQVGAVDFISKPINPVIVRARVHTHLTLKRQADQLREMAFLDGLTGLNNRRSLDERLMRESRHALRRKQPMSLLLIDVDFFKRFNDRYGHQAGDDALRQVGAVLKSNMLRPIDLAARYGGEEFVCMLPETPLDGALAVAERLRQGVARLNIAHAANDADDATGTVSVSIGVACLQGSSDNPPEDLIAAADHCLYEAKRAGRNRVVGCALAAANDG